ncbi:MAG: hypothetical protein AUI02_03640 [Acidobacteria bacterium 13_2_20CM_2_57_12]|nr:MAG: hypothetical protein AUI02_03640 [Acidobacteria bacterium 13_2_20CM_2_57_12]
MGALSFAEDVMVYFLSNLWLRILQKPAWPSPKPLLPASVHKNSGSTGCWPMRICVNSWRQASRPGHRFPSPPGGGLALFARAVRFSMVYI